MMHLHFIKHHLIRIREILVQKTNLILRKIIAQEPEDSHHLVSDFAAILHIMNKILPMILTRLDIEL